MSYRFSEHGPLDFGDVGAGAPIGIAGRRRKVDRNAQRSNGGVVCLIALTAAAALFAFADLSDENLPLASPIVLDLLCLCVGLLPALVQAALTQKFDIFEPIHLAVGAFTLLTGVRALYLIVYQTA